MSSQLTATRRVLSELHVNTPITTSPSMADLKRSKGNSPSKAGAVVEKSIYNTPGEKRILKDGGDHVEKQGSNKRLKSAHEHASLDARSSSVPEGARGLKGISNLRPAGTNAAVCSPAPLAFANALQPRSSPGSSSPVSSNGMPI